ncbi:hypothetical protein VTL71DRAFT_11712 [Oculimacula yallundae]|uniref:SH3 domain-containing protein n=1 Tax=Oculimacula yallundae TaxID=86028 RepID=A0ABR4CQX9_9HELO
MMFSRIWACARTNAVFHSRLRKSHAGSHLLYKKDRGLSSSASKKMPEKDLDSPPPPRGLENSAIAEHRRIVLLSVKLVESEDRDAVLKDIDQPTAVRLMKLADRTKCKDIPKRWAVYDSHSIANFENRDPSDLFFFKGDIIEVYEECEGEYAIGLGRGRLGIYYKPWTTDRQFVRALDDFPATAADELSLKKGDVVPSIQVQGEPEWLYVFKENERGLVPALFVEPETQQSVEDVKRNKDYYFSHRRLDNPATQIRLIKIAREHLLLTAGVDMATLFFTVEHYDLDKCPPYSALSYCWGDPLQNNGVCCDGKFIRISNSLFYLMKWFYTSKTDIEKQGLRSVESHAEDSAVYLWADGICINQVDIGEKNHQIPLMRDIYTKGREVKAYVGESDKSMAALLSMQIIHETCKGQPEWTALPQDVIEKDFKYVDWEAIFGFLSQPCFERSWIIQEIILGQDVQLWYGQASFPIDYLYKWVFCMDHYNVRQSESAFGITVKDAAQQKSFASSMSHIYNLGLVKANWTKGTPTSFVEVLRRFRSAKAQNPKDKVYSLLSLSSSHYRTSILPDYSEAKTVADVYYELAVCAAGTAEFSNLLHYSGTKRQVQGLPSWVPDWSFVPRRSVIPYLYFSAGDSTMQIWIDVPSKTLTALGAVVDTISGCMNLDWLPSGVLKQFVSDDPLTQVAALDFILRNKIGGIGRTESCYAVGEEFDDAVSHTLTLGQAWGDRRAGPSDRASYEAFKEYSPLNLSALEKTKEEEVKLERDLFPFLKLAQAYVPGRQLCVTNSGRFGNMPDDASTGDLIVILSGFNMPFVVRPQDGKYLVIGPCYVHGIMDGELLTEDMNCLEFKVQGAESQEFKFF